MSGYAELYELMKEGQGPVRDAARRALEVCRDKATADAALADAMLGEGMGDGLEGAMPPMGGMSELSGPPLE